MKGVCQEQTSLMLAVSEIFFYPPALSLTISATTQLVILSAQAAAYPGPQLDRHSAFAQACAAALRCANQCSI
jgi:hypothetical protein